MEVISLLKLVMMYFIPLVVLWFINRLYYKNEMKDEIKYFEEKLFILAESLLVFYFVYLVLNNDGLNIQEVNKLVFFKFIYYFMLFSWFILINYFSTTYDKFRKCIKTFLNEFSKFVKNFLLNLLLFMFVVLFKNIGDLSIAVIGSYFFYAITEISKGYKGKIKDNNKDFSKKNIIIQIILNIFIMFAFERIENCFNQVFLDKPQKFDRIDFFWFSVLVVGCLINFYFPNIEAFISKKIKKWKGV